MSTLRAVALVGAVAAGLVCASAAGVLMLALGLAALVDAVAAVLVGVPAAASGALIMASALEVLVPYSVSLDAFRCSFPLSKVVCQKLALADAQYLGTRYWWCCSLQAACLG